MDELARFMASRDPAVVEQERLARFEDAQLEHPRLRNRGSARLRRVTKVAVEWEREYPKCKSGHRLIPGMFYPDYRSPSRVYKTCAVCSSISARNRRLARIRAERDAARKEMA